MTAWIIILGFRTRSLSRATLKDRDQRSEVKSQRSEFARRQSAVNLFFILLVLILFPSISHATEEDPLKDMDLNFLTEETSIEDTAKFLTFGGYLESRDQVRVKEMDEPISLRQRLWLDCYLGQDWIRGFTSAYFDYDPAFRDWTDDNDEIYYVELNEAYLTIDTERMDFIFGKKMMRWGTGDGINPMDLINPRGY
jgi:hypothetical protein